MTICLADRRRLTLSEHELVDADVVRAEGFDETRRDICRGRASFHLHTAIVQTIDSNLPTSTCDDGELESHTSEMGMLSKAKLAAKQAALKGVPKSTRDLSLGKVAAAARKPILVSRTRSRAGERNKKKSKCKYCEELLLSHCLTLVLQLRTRLCHNQQSETYQCQRKWWVYNHRQI